MREFKDSKGGTWEFSLTFGTVTRIKKASEGRFDLLVPAKENDEPGGTLSTRLLYDLGEFWELLWYLVQPVAAQRGVSAEQFGELMAADCVHVAQDKFFREWADFFRGLQRADLATALETEIDHKAKSMKKLQTRVEAEIATVLPTADEALERTLSKQFGKLRASLASILED